MYALSVSTSIHECITVCAYVLYTNAVYTSYIQLFANASAPYFLLCRFFFIPNNITTTTTT